MSVSLNLKEACYASGTSKYLIILFTINHPDLEEPIYISTDPTQRIEELSTDREIIYGTKSQGKTFIYFPMEWELPDDTEDKVPSISISISNVGGELTKTVRELMTSPTVNLQFVMSDDLDFVEAIMRDFRMASVDINQMMISGELTLDLMLNEAFPMHTCTPSTTKGLFQA